MRSCNPPRQETRQAPGRKTRRRHPRPCNRLHPARQFPPLPLLPRPAPRHSKRPKRNPRRLLWKKTRLSSRLKQGLLPARRSNLHKMRGSLRRRFPKIKLSRNRSNSCRKKSNPGRRQTRRNRSRKARSSACPFFRLRSPRLPPQASRPHNRLQLNLQNSPQPRHRRFFLRQSPPL